MKTEHRFQNPLAAKVTWLKSRFSKEKRVGQVALNCIWTMVCITFGISVQGALTLVPSGAIWRYLDNGSDQGIAWRGTNFNDTGWATGQAQLGYGDGDEVTTISYGPDPTNKYIATYFRHTFLVDNLASITNAAVRLLRDDGAMVYLNGSEVFRSNMPEDPIAFDTKAYGAFGYENTYFSSPIPPALLLSGTNVLAVEVHQATRNSSDLSFDLELLANTPLGVFPPVVTISSPSNGAVFSPGQTFTVAASATGGDGQVTRLELFLDSRLLGVYPTNAAQLDWMTTKGLYSVIGRAQNDHGAFGFSEPVCILVSPPGAQTFFYSQFTSGDGLVLLGAASLWFDVLRLTPSLMNESGAAWLAAKHPVADGFDTMFQFQITDPGGAGGDGFALVIYGAPSPTYSGGGGGMGYHALTNSLAIEFDTYRNDANNDPNDNHISVHSRGTAANDQSETASLGSASNLQNLWDGGIHTGMVEYIPGLLKIYLDNLVSPILTVPVDLSTWLALDDGQAWVGFTAGTGGSKENHDILAWSFRSLTPASPVAIIRQPRSQAVLEGEPVILSARATGYPLAYQWYRDAAPIPGATQPDLIIPSATLADWDEYFVIASNQLNAVQSPVAFLRVYPDRSVPLLDLHQPWRYDQAGVDLGTAWKEAARDDSVWPSGPGALGVEVEPSVTPYLRTVLSLVTGAGAQVNTFYFRTRFVVTNPASFVGLSFNNLVDDGAVVYLNGVELYRLNMPAGPVSYATPASSPVEASLVETNVPATHLRPGTNVLAAEVHQVSSTSSDVVFGLSLNGLPHDFGPIHFLTQSEDQTVLVNSNTAMNAIVAGAQPIQFQWIKDRSSLTNCERVTGVWTDTLCFTNLQPGDEGTYCLWASNLFGAVTSAPCRLAVVEPFHFSRSADDSLLVTNGQLQITLRGIPPDARHVFLEASTNLVDWQMVRFTAALGSAAGFGEPATNWPQRFYRARALR